MRRTETGGRTQQHCRLLHTSPQTIKYISIVRPRYAIRERPPPAKPVRREVSVKCCDYLLVASSARTCCALIISTFAPHYTLSVLLCLCLSSVFECHSPPVLASNAANLRTPSHAIIPITTPLSRGGPHTILTAPP